MKTSLEKVMGKIGSTKNSIQDQREYSILKQPLTDSHLLYIIFQEVKLPKKNNF